MNTKLLICFASSILFGCDTFVGEPKTIYLESATPISRQDEGIILERLKEMAVTNLVVSEEQGRKVIRANGVPPDAELAFILQHRGVFKVISAPVKTWFSNKDIVDVVAAFDDNNRPVLNIKLTDAAAARVADLSQSDTNTVLAAMFDAEVLTQARLTSPITTGALRLSVNGTAQEATLIAAILKHGALENAVTLVTTKPGR